jgi:hypothetical protein
MAGLDVEASAHCRLTQEMNGTRQFDENPNRPRLDGLAVQANESSYRLRQNFMKFWRKPTVVHDMQLHPVHPGLHPGLPASDEACSR